MRAEADGRWAFALTVAAFTWAVALVVGALVAPVYSVKSSGGSAATETLVGENGPAVLLPVAVPAAFAALVWFALHRRCSRGSRAGARLAWLLIGLLAVLSVVAAASIGAFVMPVALLLFGAAALTPQPDLGEQL